MNKKKNQTSIDLDAIMTEVLNLFTPEEQQEVILRRDFATFFTRDRSFDVDYLFDFGCWDCGRKK